MRPAAAAFLVAAGIAACGFDLIAQTAPEKTVWSGVYTDAQALRGQAEYVSRCASCHRDDLSGYESILKGPRFMNQYREAPVYRLFDKMKTTMPRNAAGTLSDRAYLDIVSYVLKANDFPAGAEELTLADLQNVMVVGKAGAEPVPDFSLVQVIGCLAHKPDDTWVLTRATVPVRAPQPQPTAGESAVFAATPLGTEAFELMVSASQNPTPLEGHRVDARGLLIRRAAGNRINITGIETVAPSCGP
jgi:mono/diheme cytochrome c family protein